MLKAPEYGADALILDLEDSVPLVEKEAARQAVRRILDSLGTSGETLFVRINELRSDLIEDDLTAIVSAGLYGVLLPMIEGAEDIVAADALLKRHEERAGLAAGTLLIMPGIETARAMREAYEIACASPRVAYMGAGHVKAGDGARDLGFQWTREGKETYYVRSKVLLDARAAGDPYPCAGPWSDMTDLEGLRAYLVEMRQLGYTGFTALHPSHVAIANEVFTPTADDIENWKGVVAAMAEAEKEGRAAVLFEGQLVDIAMRKTAEDMLEMARRLGVLTK